MTQQLGEQQVLQDENLAQQYLTFLSDSKRYGILISRILQVIKPQEMTVVPEFPSYTKGVINLRGNIVSIIDMRLRFGKSEMQYDDRACIIIIILNHTLVGLLVDEVDELASLTPQDILTIENDKDSEIEKIKQFLCGKATVKGREIFLIDLIKLISTKI